MGLRPPKAMKSGSCSATTVAGSAALPFVISTGAPKERSGEICGVSGPFLKMFFTEPAATSWQAQRSLQPWASFG